MAAEYAHAAIIHDYLYRTQTTSRDDADQSFRMAMQEFSIDAATATTIYQAIHLGGNSAWQENAKLKASGEKRVLKDFPDDPQIRWSEWKKNPNVFADWADSVPSLSIDLRPPSGHPSSIHVAICWPIGTRRRKINRGPLSIRLESKILLAWKAVLIVEDDARNGVDHLNSHRTMVFVVVRMRRSIPLSIRTEAC